MPASVVGTGSRFGALVHKTQCVNPLTPRLHIQCSNRNARGHGGGEGRSPRHSVPPRPGADIQSTHVERRSNDSARIFPLFTRPQVTGVPCLVLGVVVGVVVRILAHG